jgi:ABC-type transport system involved in multi-copper enzyme maturation permease subunit
MKALAILKDSFLETIDFKLFYVLIILSMVLAAAVLCVQFTQYDPDVAIESNLSPFGKVTNVETLETSKFSPYGRYRFVYTDKLAGIEDRKNTSARLLETLKHMPGFKDTKVLEKDGLPSGAIQLETTINWGLLRHSGEVHILFGVWKFPLRNEPRGAIIFVIQSLLVNAIAGMVGIIIAIIVTAGFVPNMLRKGTVDFLLVKPISRSVLLIYKYVGGLMFVFFNAAVLVGLSWLSFCFTTNSWSGWYLLSAFVLTGYFAILYSFSVLIGVLTRSMLACVLLTIGFWFILGIVGEVRNSLHVFAKTHEVSQTAIDIVDGIHWVLPKPGDLKVLNAMLISRASGLHEVFGQEMGVPAEIFSWNLAISTSGAFIVVMLGIACWRFSKQDY